MSGIASCRKALRVLETLKLGKWLLGTSDRRGQDSELAFASFHSPTAVGSVCLHIGFSHLAIACQ